MNKVGMPVLRCAVALVGFAFLASSMLLCGGPAHAAMSARNIIPKGSDELSLIQHAQYVYGGYSYCWFPAGWQGPGWYVCNYGPGGGGPRVGRAGRWARMVLSRRAAPLLARTRRLARTWALALIEGSPVKTRHVGYVGFLVSGALARVRTDFRQ